MNARTHSFRGLAHSISKHLSYLFSCKVVPNIYSSRAQENFGEADIRCVVLSRMLYSHKSFLPSHSPVSATLFRNLPGGSKFLTCLTISLDIADLIFLVDTLYFSTCPLAMSRSFSFPIWRLFFPPLVVKWQRCKRRRELATKVTALTAGINSRKKHVLPLPIKTSFS